MLLHDDHHDLAPKLHFVVVLENDGPKRVGYFTKICLWSLTCDGVL